MVSLLKSSLLLLVIIFPALSVIAQANTDEWSVKKDFLIILSTKSYKEALIVAKKATANTGIKLDLRGLAENKINGLSYSRATCTKEDITYPAYYARGRWDDGTYISIEHSNAYSEFARGYYIVVAGSGNRKEEELITAYQKVKRFYKDAYFKSNKVYLGCIH